MKKLTDKREQIIRKNAAELAVDLHGMKRKGIWTIREWNKQVRITVNQYIENMRRFYMVNGE